jgi:hypothetical protein
MTPTQMIVGAAQQEWDVQDALGRSIRIRKLTALDTLRLFKAAGPSLAQNEPWLSVASLAMSVVEVDSVPVPPPLSESQIEAMVARLGDEGLSAISNFLEAHDERAMPNRVDNLGNLPGTPT